MKNKKVCHKVKVHPRGKAKGVIRSVKVFPESSAGNSGPFALRSTPTGLNFAKWVEYYVHFVGFHIEKLNGLQFDMCERSNAKRMAFENYLTDLATELNPVAPPKLNWPFLGLYRCEPPSPIAAGWRGFVIQAYFQQDSDYEMVVNVGLTIEASSGPGDGSSSSFLATSSS